MAGTKKLLSGTMFIGKRKAAPVEPVEEASEEDVSEEEELLTAVELQASRLDAAKARELEEARAEQEEQHLQDYEPYELPSAAEVERELAGAPNLPAVRRRIQDVARVLASFKHLREPGCSRSDYMERLMADLALYYGCGFGAAAGGGLSELTSRPSPRAREPATTTSSSPTF